MTNSVQPSRRQEVLERDQGRCRYCGCQTNDAYGQDAPTIDHVVPLDRRGSNDISNLVLACWLCNHQKGNRTPAGAGMDLLPAGTLIVFPRHRRMARHAEAEWMA